MAATAWSISSRSIKPCNPELISERQQNCLHDSWHKQNRMCSMASTTTAPALKYSDLDGEHCFALMAERTSIGRSPDQDLVLKEAFVSRRHALITRQDGKFEVVDQNSSHGTFLNGERIQRVALKSGDCLQFGSLNAAS